MNAVGEIVVAEIPCISCGYNLRMQPVDGRCPECDASISDSIRDTLLAVGCSRIRGIAGALTLASTLNILLVCGCLIFVAAIMTTEGAAPLTVLLVLGLTTYALLQVVVAQTTTRPGDRFGRRRPAIMLSGYCFVAATLAPWLMVVAESAHIYSNVPTMISLVACMVLFPALGVFSWVVGDHYAWLCTTGGLHGLARWCRQIGQINVLGVGLMELGFAFWSLAMALEMLGNPNIGNTILEFLHIPLMLSFYVGFLALTIGLFAATILQFTLSRRFKALAQTVAENPILTGPAPLTTTLHDST